VEGKPLFLVYRATKLPEPKRTTEIWRREAEKAGLGGLFLARVESFAEFGDPREMGFDCGVEFRPRMTTDFWQLRTARRRWWHRRKLRTAEPAFYDHAIFEYEEMVRHSLEGPAPGYPRIPCVCPSWDNSPRRKRAAVIFMNSTPEKYERWLREVVNRRIKEMAAGEERSISPQSLIFINAWNEWAEGNHLEPCQRWGRAYLEATRRALSVRVAEEKVSAELEIQRDIGAIT